MGGRETVRIERAAQLRALASPVRHRIIAAFEALGRCTVRDLADHLGAEPESLYYHVRALRRVGLVVGMGKRATERRSAELFELVSRDLEVDVESGDAEYRAAYADVGSALFRWADRRHRAALEAPGVRQSGPARERTLLQFHARLCQSALVELNQKFEKIETLLREKEDPDGILYVITLMTSPTSPRLSSS